VGGRKGISLYGESEIAIKEGELMKKEGCRSRYWEKTDKKKCIGRHGRRQSDIRREACAKMVLEGAGKRG